MHWHKNKRLKTHTPEFTELCAKRPITLVKKRNQVKNNLF